MLLLLEAVKRKSRFSDKCHVEDKKYTTGILSF